jgi:RNA 2',3'-cyclic 3'-phosphodiesterase
VRLFVALHPPPQVLAELCEAVGDLRRQHEELRWVSEESWHITLAFLGEVPEERLPELTERLGRAAARHPAPVLSIGHGGRFGDRVLWMRVDGDRDPLKRLAASVAAAVRRTRIPVEDRPFRPHITLGRSRGRDAVDLRPLVRNLAGFSGTPWTADELRLVRSYLGPKVRHETLASWPLRRPNESQP